MYCPRTSGTCSGHGLLNVKKQNLVAYVWTQPQFFKKVDKRHVDYYYNFRLVRRLGICKKQSNMPIRALNVAEKPSVAREVSRLLSDGAARHRNGT